ncbi:MAG: glycosyltransferase family 4 protein [Pseudomonadota bacterium]
MKIFEVVADGRPGGGTTVVLALVAALREQGFAVHFVSQKDSYAMSAIAGLAVPSHGVNFFPLRVNPTTILAIAALLKRERPDLVHAHGARAALNIVLARLLPGVPKFPLIYSVHGYHLGGGIGWLRSLAMLSECICHRAAVANVFVSVNDRDRGLRDGYLSMRDNPQVIYNGINLDDLPAPATPNLKTIAFLGRLTAQKNPATLLDVAERLRDENYQMKIIGGGDLEEEIRAAIIARGLSEMITLTGALPHQQALAELRGVGVLVLPSLWEGLPLVLAEAMAMRVPVVASAVSGNSEIVRDGSTGFLVHDQDPDAYAAAVRRLTTDMASRRTIITNGEALVRSQFLLSLMVSRHIELYQKHLSAEN